MFHIHKSFDPITSRVFSSNTRVWMIYGAVTIFIIPRCTQACDKGNHFCLYYRTLLSLKSGTEHVISCLKCITRRHVQVVVFPLWFQATETAVRI